VDKSRGPLNEGGLYAERQGWHLPGFDDSKWSNSRPTDGISAPGVQFYRYDWLNPSEILAELSYQFRTKFNLNIPSGVDYPLALAVTNSTVNTHYRAQVNNLGLFGFLQLTASQFYVNGWQFGKYVNSIGPQKSFPVRA
jgi:hypothetical protein